MNKSVISVFAVVCSLGLNAQTIGNSPYSSYGIGDTKYDNSIETTSMAGISAAYVWDFNNQFNFQNPAANQNLEITSIRIQATNENQYLKSDYNNAKIGKHSSYLSGIFFALPLSKKVKFGFGYQPYSSKDYNLTKTNTLPDGTLGTHNFYGDGSLNIIQAAFGYSISPEFSVGLNTNFHFGKLSDTEEISYENTTLINSHEFTNKVTSFNFTLGTVYQKKLKVNKKLTFGATYTFGNTADFKTQYTNSTYYLSSGNKMNESILNSASKNSKNAIPQEFTFGAGYGHDGKWFVSSQLNYKKGVTTSLASNEPFEVQDSYRVAVGGWYLPNYNNFRNYFSRVIYRYGAFYEKGNLKINGHNINKYGIALGASFPFQKSNVNRLSTLDLGIQLGQRGTLKDNLVRENFINFTIGINFANKWFEKQFYD